MSKGKMPKAPQGKKTYKNVFALIVTAVFLAAGVVLCVIAWHDTVIKWMANTGIACLVVALIPAIYVIANVVNKKIEES